ncbi:cell wall hydrolase [Ammoniphilus sp. CFH 90114]|uniref:cell wall hydrolase n=1 Tax=Ammoniphilus sp. CFH 90114 TaxID=2493665 RepID=UPI00100DF42F|nr:cell wall hydrolase [Ammoniphilus sp. CFH 90114]RXT08131.1 LysM peptidoglycan-binding domain-containing protein [Ammoniphilus sp. CFH 90114]
MLKKWLLSIPLFTSVFAVISCLFIGQANAVESIVYKVEKGDTLWRISKITGVNVDQLKKANRLSSDFIRDGDKLIIPRDNNVNSKRAIKFTKKDYDWFVRIIEAEAGGESFEGKVAVGSVVLNRVLHKDYPGTITGVIFHKVKHVYQFSPVADGRIHKVKPSKDSYRAAQEALRGLDPTSGALFFYNPHTARSQWIRTRVVVAEIGRHNFAH